MRCGNCERREAAEGHLLCWACADGEAEDHGWSLGDDVDD